MIWLTSDHHFYHRNIIKYCDRPYSSVEEMNECLIRNWNDVVGIDDEVYVLGDFSMAARPVEVFCPRLMGKKYLVPGNHDHCHPYHKKSRKGDEARQKQLDFYGDCGFTVLPIHHHLEVTDIGTVNLCHMPYKGDLGDNHDKYERFRLEDDGKWLFCGHVHEKWKQKSRMINVGVDVWNYSPVSLDTLVELIKAA